MSDDDALQRAFEEGATAAARGDEAAPGCTTTPQGRAFLAGYVEGARRRREQEPEPARITARPVPGVTPTVTAGTVELAAGALLHVPPAAAAGTPCPLVICFHGAGSSASAGLALLSELADGAGLVLLAPQSTRSTWDGIHDRYGPDVRRLDAALTVLFRGCPVDPTRIALAGFSDGASFALSLALLNGELVTHALGFSPGFVRQAGASAAERRPRIFVSHGTADAVLPIDRCSRRLVPALRGAGCDVTYTEFDGGHIVPPECAAAAVDWLLRA